MSELETRLVEDVILLVHSSRNPSDAEWDEHLRVMRETASRTRDYPLIRMLVVTNGGTPTLKQRIRLEKIYGELRSERIPIAVVLDNAFARSVLPMFNLLGLNIRGFGPHEIDTVATWLSLDGPRARRLAVAIEDVSNLVDGGRISAAVVEGLRDAAARQSPEARIDAERHRIARDLHDGLGAALAGLQWRIRAATAQSRPGSVGSELAGLNDRLGSVLDELRGVVWTMRAAEAPWGDVCAYLFMRLEQLDVHRRIRRYDRAGDEALMLPRGVVLSLLRSVQLATRERISEREDAAVAIELSMDATTVSAVITDETQLDDEALDALRHTSDGMRASLAASGGAAELTQTKEGLRWTLTIPIP